jgi:hypothetical protein
MQSVVGILRSHEEAERVVAGLRSIGVRNARINVLMPDANQGDLSEIPTTETEQPGTAVLWVVLKKPSDEDIAADIHITAR